MLVFYWNRYSHPDLKNIHSHYSVTGNEEKTPKLYWFSLKIRSFRDVTDTNMDRESWFENLKVYHSKRTDLPRLEQWLIDDFSDIFHSLVTDHWNKGDFCELAHMRHLKQFLNIFTICKLNKHFHWYIQINTEVQKFWLTLKRVVPHEKTQVYFAEPLHIENVLGQTIVFEWTVFSLVWIQGMLSLDEANLLLKVMVDVVWRSGAQNKVHDFCSHRHWNRFTFNHKHEQYLQEP